MKTWKAQISWSVFVSCSNCNVSSANCLFSLRICVSVCVCLCLWTGAVCYFVQCYSQFLYRRCWFFAHVLFKPFPIMLTWHRFLWCLWKIANRNEFFIKTLVQEINYIVWKLQQSAQNYLVRHSHWLVWGKFNPLSWWICDDAVFL